MIDRMVMTIDERLKRIVAGCLSYTFLAIENRAWRRFIARVGLQADASGDLIDVYAAGHRTGKETREMRFSSLQVAHDTIIGCVVRSIRSVVLGKAPPDHVRETLGVAFIGLSVDAGQAHRLCRMAVPELPLSGGSDLSALISDRT